MGYELRHSQVPLHSQPLQLNFGGLKNDSGVFHTEMQCLQTIDTENVPWSAPAQVQAGDLN